MQIGSGSVPAGTRPTGRSSRTEGDVHHGDGWLQPFLACRGIRAESLLDADRVWR